MKTKLLGSSPSIEGIESLIASFWFSPPGVYTVEGEKVLRRGKPLLDVRVVQKKGRYRFERVLNT